MIIEIVITLLIVGAAAYIIYNSIKNKAQGKCDCADCSNHCKNRKKPGNI